MSGIPSKRARKPAALTDGQAGLTMVEVACACLIIAIMIGFAIPVANKSINAYSVRGAADHIAERLMAARSLAMAKNANVTVSFNKSSGQYGFDFTNPPDGVPDSSDPSDPGQSYYVEGMPGGTSLVFPSNSNIMITFNSRGEMPIGTAIPAGQLGLSVGVTGYSNSATVWVNLRGKVWVTEP